MNFNPFKKSPSVDTTQILTALARVVHPEQKRDIVQLMMVKDLVVDNGKVAFTIVLDEVGAPIRAPIKRQVRASLAGVPGIRDVKIKWEVRNVPRAQLTDKIENLQVKYSIAVASGKGGIGKSTVAVNLACALARDGARVGLIDADVHGPNIPLMMGINEQPLAFGENVIPLIAHNVKLMSMGFRSCRSAGDLARTDALASAAAIFDECRVGRSRFFDRGFAAGDGRRATLACAIAYAYGCSARHDAARGRDNVAFTKLPEQFGFAIEYTDASNNLRYYEPDFVAVVSSRMHYLIETKGREDLDVANKDRAATLWAENATRLTGSQWQHVKVPQKEFEKLQPDELTDLLVFAQRALV